MSTEEASVSVSAPGEPRAENASALGSGDMPQPRRLAPLAGAGMGTGTCRRSGAEEAAAIAREACRRDAAPTLAAMLALAPECAAPGAAVEADACCARADSTADCGDAACEGRRCGCGVALLGAAGLVACRRRSAELGMGVSDIIREEARKVLGSGESACSADASCGAPAAIPAACKLASVNVTLLTSVLASLGADGVEGTRTYPMLPVPPSRCEALLLALSAW